MDPFSNLGAVCRLAVEARGFKLQRDAGRAAAAIEELAADGLAARALSIDLNDHATIAAAARIIESRYGRLDILVNNAGVVDADDGQPSTSAPEAARGNMDTNIIGTLAVTQAMLPLLRKCEGRSHRAKWLHDPGGGARLPVQYALLSVEDGVSGKFVEASGVTPW